MSQVYNSVNSKIKSFLAYINIFDIPRLTREISCDVRLIRDKYDETIKVIDEYKKELEAERVEQSISSQFQEAKAYLTDTGWIWEKYNRNVLVLKDMTSEEFSLKYADIISKQEEYRALINSLEVQIPNNEE